jgi:signal transduction histidine kinase
VANANERYETFSVDAKLLRELGERLVGRPHIALAELIKNSFDADARVVTISFSRDRIEVLDDGHGMSPDDLLKRWLRIGTTQKERERRSPELGRTLTGSKGVGRLSSQILAADLVITSVGLRDPSLAGSKARRNASPEQLWPGIRAAIRWEDAIESGDLTEVKVLVSDPPPDVPLAEGSKCGTRIVLNRLHTDWNASRFRQLAEQVWHLQPPFDADVDDDSFKIVLNTKYQKVVETFEAQMNALFDIWTGRITGKLRPATGTSEAAFPLPARLPSIGRAEDLEDGLDVEADEQLGPEDLDGDPADPDETIPTVPDGVRRPAARPKDRLLDITVELRDGEPTTQTYLVAASYVHEAEFELRVFSLHDRQPEGVSVVRARAYLDNYGGVGIFDGSFRLPYYGPDQDWLQIDAVHAARITTSKLVPPTLQASRGMNNLPSNRRVFGQVRVSTTREQALATDAGEPIKEALAVQVTRDRLVDNQAYQQLRVLVRAGLDLYAMEQTRQSFAKSRPRRRRADEPPPSASLAEITEVIEGAKDTLPASTYTRLHQASRDAAAAAQAIEDSARANGSLLGALATAGITTLAYEHELSKQLLNLQTINEKLEGILDQLDGTALTVVTEVREELTRWVARAEGIRKIFSPLTEEEDRKLERRFSAKTLAAEVAEHLAVLATVDVVTDGVPIDLKLPKGSLAAWSAILQNLYVNSFNAVRAAPNQLVVVDGGGDSRNGWLRVQDRGIGVDLPQAERYFEPFQREPRPAHRRGSVPLGGTGLGLTIVRMIADELRCAVAFTEPEDGFSTAVTISWQDAL